MNYYDVLKILSITEACKDKAKAMLSSASVYNDRELATLCSYFIALHDLKTVIDNYLLNTEVSDSEITNKEFLAKMILYVDLSAKFEDQASKYFSFEIH